MAVENIQVEISKKQLRQKANCSDADFKSDPIITISIPNDHRIYPGWIFKIKFETKRVEFTAIKVISQVSSASRNKYQTYTLEVTRKIISE